MLDAYMQLTEDKALEFIETRQLSGKKLSAKDWAEMTFEKETIYYEQKYNEMCTAKATSISSQEMHLTEDPHANRRPNQ